MIKINVPSRNIRYQTIQQVTLIHSILCVKPTKEMQVLGYMIRHNTGGVFSIKRGYRADIAKNIRSNGNAVKNILKKLIKKKLIKYITNMQGNNLGVYTFCDPIKILCKKDSVILFNFTTTLASRQ